MFTEALSNVVNGTGFESVFQSINNVGLSNPTTAIAISLGVAGAVYLTHAHFQDEKNLPPLVPYTNPIKGSTEEYQADPSGWVKKQKAKYGPVFRAHLNGRIVTVVGKDMVRDVALRPDMSFLRALSDDIDIGEMIVGENTWHFNELLHKTITKHLTPNLKNITATVVTHLDTLIKEQFGDLKEPLILDSPSDKLLKIIAKASARVFVGEELCEREELLDSFQNLTMDTAKLLRGNPWFKYFPFANKMWAKMQYKFTAPVGKHRALLKREVGPLVERRLKEQKLPDWKRPDDMLQTLIEMYPEDQTNIDELVMILIMLIFASVHTTSMNSNFALYFIAAYPQYIEELIKEQDEVFKELGITDTSDPINTWTFEVIKRLEKLDSFIRETFRYRDDHLALPHRHIEFKDIQLPNGMVVPKGQHISLDHEEIYTSEEWQGPNPEVFNPWRFVGKNKQATKIGADFLPFGIGRFACPGRFFAIQEIKTVVSIIIRNYHVSMVDKFKIIRISSAARHPYGRMKFENRQS